jgi:hypothetical protein
MEIARQEQLNPSELLDDGAEDPENCEYSNVPIIASCFKLCENEINIAEASLSARYTATSFRGQTPNPFKALIMDGSTGVDRVIPDGGGGADNELADGNRAPFTGGNAGTVGAGVYDPNSTPNPGNFVVIPPGLIVSRDSKAAANRLAVNLAQSQLNCFFTNRSATVTCLGDVGGGDCGGDAAVTPVGKSSCCGSYPDYSSSVSTAPAFPCRVGFTNESNFKIKTDLTGVSNTDFTSGGSVGPPGITGACQDENATTTVIYDPPTLGYKYTVTSTPGAITARTLTSFISQTDADNLACNLAAGSRLCIPKLDIAFYSGDVQVCVSAGGGGAGADGSFAATVCIGGSTQEVNILFSNEAVTQ